MPELPDINAYLAALESRVRGQPLDAVRVASPFVLRSVSPRPSEAASARVVDLRRIGKRIALGMEGAADARIFLVLHLMIAGRLHWKERGAKIPGRYGLAAFDFPTGSLLFTEAGTKKRASLTLVRGEAALAALDPGGIDVLASPLAAFRAALLRESHTLKRTLTDPRIFSGIGNSYSDEILHRARLSPVRLVGQLSDEEIEELQRACRSVLTEWSDRLCAEARKSFPEKVTAFRPEMAVHGRYGLPCPVCGAKVQRIVHADNETNYCARCQTGGRLLADRALSRLLKTDWPRTIEELEERAAARNNQS
jgi:formamidopyrimidine-DNA glycosylase